MSTNSWDRYSLIQSPQLLEHFPVPHVPSVSKSSLEGDHSSCVGEELDDSYMSYGDSDADSGMCINCCSQGEEQIAMKTLKENEKKPIVQTEEHIQNETFQPSKLYAEKDAELKKRRYSIPFIYPTDYVYINEEDASTVL